MSESIFKTLEEDFVVAHDLLGNKYKRPIKGFKFCVGVYGVLKNGNKILIQRNPLVKKFALPGGNIKIGESILEGLVREFKEQTGLKVEEKRFIGIVEDMFTDKGDDSQRVLVFYELKEVGGKLIKEAEYMDISELSIKNMQDSFWKGIEFFKKLK